MRQVLLVLLLCLFALPAQAQEPYRVSLPLLAKPDIPNVSAPVPADQLQVRSGSTRINRYTGYWHVVGEVVNPTPSPTYVVEVTVRLLDAGGQLVAIADSYAALTEIRSGRRSPFSIYVGSPPATAAAFTVAVTDWNPSSSLAYRDATIVNAQTRDNFGLEVFGVVRNPEQLELRSVEVVATFFDPAGAVIDVKNSLASPSTLAAGATGTYVLSTSNTALAGARYELQTQGYLAP
jgi:hypothetical protein